MQVFHKAADHNTQEIAQLGIFQFKKALGMLFVHERDHKIRENTLKLRLKGKLQKAERSLIRE